MFRQMVALFLLAALFSTSLGCSYFNRWRGDSLSDRDANFGESLREPGPPGQLFGFSERARQVERNVGVR